jgi:hypothetical protein
MMPFSKTHYNYYEVLGTHAQLNWTSSTRFQSIFPTLLSMVLFTLEQAIGQIYILSI